MFNELEFLSAIKRGSKENKRSSKARRNTRGSIEIIADILPLCETGTKRTHIMYKANLSYEMLKFYVRYTIELGLIEEDNAQLKMTEKGRQFLVHYRNITRLLDNYEYHGTSPPASSSSPLDTV